MPILIIVHGFSLGKIYGLFLLCLLIIIFHVRMSLLSIIVYFRVCGYKLIFMLGFSSMHVFGLSDVSG